MTTAIESTSTPAEQPAPVVPEAARVHTLADLVATVDETSEAARATEREEYKTILSRAASPCPADAGRIVELASALGIDKQALHREITQAVEDHAHRLKLADLQKQEIERVARVAKLEEREGNLTMATASGADSEVLLRALEAGTAAWLSVPYNRNKNPARFERFGEDFLRSRGWAPQAMGWRDPKSGAPLPFPLAIDLQIDRDLTPQLKQRAADHVSALANVSLGMNRDAAQMD